MQAVILRGQAEVGAIIHDELDVRSETRPEFPCLVEYLPGVARFVPILEQRDSGGGEFLGGGEHSGVGKTRSVENRIESRKLKQTQGSSFLSTECNAW